MSTAETIARIRAAADELMEIRRYVKGQPDVALKTLHRVWGTSLGIPDDADDIKATKKSLKRMTRNVQDGLRVIRSDPLVLEGHLYAAARTLQSIAARMEDGR